MQSLRDALYSPSPLQPCASSGASSEVLYTPQVKDDLTPKIDQVFVSLEDAHSFYNDYAREAGFSVRIHSSKVGKGGHTIRKEFVCHKEGLRAKKYTQNVSENTTRKRGLTRENCGAKITVVKRGEGFAVTQFVASHNHTLATPKKVHLLRSHRNMSAAQRALTQQLGDANIPTHQQMSILAMQAGGLENVGCSQQDLYNALRDKRKMVEGHDASLLVEYFEAEQEKNPSFTFSILPDAEGSLYHCFWADATMRKSYKYFGDVAVFDSTYQTNKYGLIFAPIIGVNHHGQTTLFGCAFLSGEKVDAFEWLFTRFLEAMPAGPPKMIITDQDPAMTRAIANLLPKTLHRYCIWHILSKFSEKVSAIYYKEHYDEFHRCIWNSETPEEFEERWVQVVAKAQLSTNDWLNTMYEIRERWVPAYTRHVFSAHMTSSQRAEGCHAFFKRYVSPNNSLMDFVTRFARAISHIRHNELDSDHKDVNEKPLLVTKTVMESCE